MSEELLKKEFLDKYTLYGHDKFYSYIIAYAINKLVLIKKNSYKGMLPNLEFIEYYDRFMVLYRREGEEVYLKLARLFRKAAHKVYRVMLKMKMTEYNAKFLNLV